eukprot:gene6657-9138_t
MHIHLTYTDILLKYDIVNEVHLWDYSRNREDYDNLVNMVINRSNVSGYKFFPRLKKDEFSSNKMLQYRRGGLWKTYYEYYSSAGGCFRDNDILIKADDDIVFIEIPNFQSFINGISSKHVYFANILNNDIGMIFQAKRNFGNPFIKNILNEYELLLNRNLSERILTYKDVPTPITTWKYCLCGKGDFAELIHKLFITNPSQFLTASKSYERYEKVMQRISINFYAAKFSTIRPLYRKFLQIPTEIQDDEGFFGLWPMITRSYHKWDMKLTVTHFGFNGQYENNSNFLHYIDDYREISNLVRDYLMDRKLIRDHNNSFQRNQMKRAINESDRITISLPIGIEENDIIQQDSMIGKYWIVKNNRRFKVTSFDQLMSLDVSPKNIKTVSEIVFSLIAEENNSECCV